MRSLLSVVVILLIPSAILLICSSYFFFFWTEEEMPTLCQMKRKVAYIKTHKCASGGLQNILLRKAFHHNITVALPDKVPITSLSLIRGGPWMGFTFGDRDFVSMEKLGSPFWSRAFRPEMHCLHGRYNGSELMRMLGNDVVFITSLRDPVEQFISTWQFFDLRFHYRKGIKNFITEGPEHLSIGMLYDLGLNVEDRDDPQKVDDKIEEIASTFRLVLIVEKLEESLVLLADELCWNEEDIVHIRKNTQRKRDPRPELSADEEAKLRAFLAPEYRLYNRFKEKLDERIEKYGAERMAEATLSLRQRQLRQQEECGLTKWRQATNKDCHFYLQTRKEEANLECKLMAAGEGPLLELVAAKQTRRAIEKLFNIIV